MPDPLPLQSRRISGALEALLGRSRYLAALSVPALALALGVGGSAPAASDWNVTEIRETAAMHPLLRDMPERRVSIPTGLGASLALAANAAVPLAPERLGIAAPFFMDGLPEDRARAVDCLAAAQFYEAGRGVQDQRAVAQVVLNRVRHRAYPATVCGVVFQGANRPTGCQFTFTCDGAMQHRAPSAAAWNEARQTAEQMLHGRIEYAVGQATHYHTDWVSPVWSRQMDKIAAVSTHLFFRWRGAQGELQAMSQRYGGSEPRIPAMGQLSEAHALFPEVARPNASTANDDTSLAGAALAIRNIASNASRGLSAAQRSDGILNGADALPGRIMAPGQGVHLVVLPAGASPDSFVALAQSACTGEVDCRFIGWSDPSRRATGLPMSGSSVDAISFTFVRRESGGADQIHWNCAEFPRVSSSQCLFRGS